MATYAELVDAVLRADAAGDYEGARMLADMARKMSPSAKTTYTEPEKPTEKPAEEVGLLGSVARGTKQYLSQARTALAGPSAESALAGIKRGEEINKELPSAVNIERVKDLWKQGNYGSSALEYVKQMPYALAEQAPQFASAGAGAALGSRLGSLAGLPGKIAGTGIGALAGQFLSSYLPQAGGNIERQAQEQQQRGEPINISGTAAYGSAVPQAALDVVQQRLLLGNKVLGQALGLSEAQLAKKTAVELEKLAQEKWLPTLLKGTGKGAVAEIPTEIAQQALERAQAGLSITDEDAQREYGDTALQVGMLAPVGAFTRRAEKKSAQSYLSAKEQAETAKTARDAAVARNIAEEAERNKPENLLALHDNYQTALTKMQELQLASKKPGKSATPEQIQAYQTAKAAAKAYKAETLDPLQEEYTQRSAQVAPLVAQRLSQQQQQQATQQAAAAAKQQAELKQQQDELNARMQRSEFAGPMVQQNIPGVETGTVTQPPELDLFGQPVKPREEEPTDNRARALEFAQKQQELARMLEAHQQQGSALAALGDTKGLKKLKPQRKLFENEYKYVTEQLELLGGYTDPVTERKKLVKELNTAQAQLKAMSGEGYDPVKADKLVDRIEALKAIVPFDAGAEDLVQKRIEGDFGFGKKALPADQEQTAGGNAWGVVYPKGRPKAQGPGTRAEATGAESEEQTYLAEQQAAADETVADVAEREERARQGKIRAAAEAETLQRIGQTPAKPLRAESGEPLPAMRGRPLIGSAADAILQEAEAKEQQRIAEQEAQEDQKLQAKSPSAALGQMQQLLTGEDVTYTGEEDQPQKEAPPEVTPRRVPRQDLLGGNKSLEQEAPTYEDLSARLARQLQRDDLSDDARAFLTRAEKVLPQNDISMAEDRAGYNNLTATDVARSDTYHRLLDEQLKRIERGEEGIDPEALAQRPLFEQQRLLKSSFIGDTRVQQRITDAAPGDTIRGPKSLEEAYGKVSQEELNARATPLSMQDALEPLVRSQERIKDEGTGQMELPLTHEVAGKQVSIAQELGAIKPDAASFMRFMNSPHVRTLQKALADETRALENYAEKSPALKEQIASLVARLDQMDAAQEGLRTAKDVLKANQDLVGVKRDVQSLRTAMTQMVLERMHVAGRIDGLLQQRAARQTAVDQMPISEADKTALLKQVDGVHTALQTAQIELNAVDSALKYLDAHIRVTTAQNNMAALVAAQPVAYRNATVGPAPNTTTKMGAVREELLAAKAALSKLQKPVLAKQRAERAAAATATATEKETQRKQAAITAGELEKQRTSYYEEHQRRLEAAHGQKFAGTKYEAISEAQRIAREMQEKGESKITVDDNEQIKGDPTKVLNGYQSTITGLEKSIAKKQDRSRDFLIKGLEPLLKTYQGLQAQYEKLESSAQRKVIGEKLDVARETYETAANKLIDTKLVWKGYAKDVADLATAYRKYQQLEGMISSRQVALKPTAETAEHLARQERERKTVLQSKEEKAAAAVEANKAAAEEAKTRADAPETSGEPLERTQERKARATQKTPYSGKGVGQDTTNPYARTEDIDSKTVKFSRGVVRNPSTKAQVEAELEKAFGENLFDRIKEAQVNRTIRVYGKVAEFIADNPAYYGKIPADAKGLTVGKSAVLFAENLEKGEALGVMLHEVGVHIGFRNFFNKAQFNALVKTVRNWAAKNDGSMESRIGKAALQRVEEAGTTADQVEDEILAYAVEEAVKAGVNPAGTRGGSALKNWFRMIVDAFNKALTTLGLNPEKLTTSDLVNFAYGCANLELKGTWHATGAQVAFKEFDFKYMGTGEATIQVGQENENIGYHGWGTYTAENKKIAKSYYDSENYKLLIGSIRKKRSEEESKKAWHASRPSYKGLDSFQWNDAIYAADRLRDKALYSALLSNTALPPPLNIHGLSRAEAEIVTTILGKLGNQSAKSADFLTDVQNTINNIKELATFDPRPTKEADIKFLESFNIKTIKQGVIDTFYDTPEASFLRTLRAAPEDHYLRMDEPLENQSAYVEKKFVAAISALSPEMQEKFFAAYENVNRQGVDRVNGRAVYDSVVYAFGNSMKKASVFLAEHGIPGARVLDAASRRKGKGTYNYVDFQDKEAGSAVMGRNLEPIGTTKEIFFSRGANVAGAGVDPMGGLLFRSNRITNATLSNLVAEQKPWYEKLRANFFGLGGRQNIVDMYASLDEALTRGMNANQISSLEATQAQYYLRYGEQRSQYVGQFVVNGPVSLKAKKTAQGTEYTFQSTPGATLHKVAELAGQAKLGNDATTEAYFTAYIAGKRAMSPGVGWDKLNTNPTVAREAYAEVMQKLDADPAAKTAFEAAEKEYKEYNNGLIDFNVQTGALSKAKGDQLKSMTYIPYYRVVNDNVELYIDSENIIKIGNIKNQPQLKELVGGNQKILPIFTSAMQNTAMLTDMAMRNIRTKNTAYALFKLGAVSRISDGDGPAGSNIVRFREDGKKKYAVVDTDTFGIPAELFVKSMEGIATSIPAVFRIMGIPADFLRKVITRLPTYAFRQVMRDPMTAWMTTGTSGVPILGTFRELTKMIAGRSETERKLMAAGAISSNVFTGDVRDMDKLLREMRGGRSGWEKILSKADALAIQADSATRAVIYNDSLNKGMTEMEALMRTLESMNFGRRGLSPSMQVLSMIIPFFNSQVQGLDVVYRTARGKMVFNDRLDLQSKLYSRGMLLAATTVMYAMYMQDDEAYKKATPEERYGNFFVRIPGVDEAIRIPIAFELGFIFKAIPEAIYNVAFGDAKVKPTLKGLGKMLLQSNPFGLPQAIKPAVEVKLGSSFYGPDIESQREKKELATERFRENTSEAAKAIGSVTGNINLSPIEVEYLIRGYTGNLGVAMLQVLNPLLRAPGAEVDKPSQPLSKSPLVGSLFQPNEGRDLVNQAYEVMLKTQQTQGTFEKLKLGGDKEKVEQFVREHETEIGMNAISGRIHQQLGDLAKKIRIVTASPNLTTAQKDVLIKQLKDAENKISGAFLAASEQASRTIRPEARP